MGGYTDGFTEAEFIQFQEIIRRLGEQRGSFDANDVIMAIAEVRFPQRGPVADFGNTVDFVGVLEDMEDLGYIRRVDPESTGPRRWEWVGEETGTLDMPAG